jgi:ERF superfamily protein
VSDEYGALAASLAKAQASFPRIERDKEVTVKTKTGGSYTFKYAPLDSILAAVRGPLSDNGLALVQTLDEGDLVTMLLHDGGARIIGRTPLPEAEGIQAYGSAITYLRRYSIQALLGIAAEEDDDGNQAEGNSATFRERNPRVGAADHQPPDDRRNGGLIGVAEKGTSKTSDYLLRQSPDGPFLGFRIKDGHSRSGQLLEAWGPLAEALAGIEPEILGQRIQVWGRTVTRELKNGGSYQAFIVDRIQTAELTLPAPDPVFAPDSGGSGSEAEPSADTKGSDIDAELDALPMFQDDAA